MTEEIMIAEVLHKMTLEVHQDLIAPEVLHNKRELILGRMAEVHLIMTQEVLQGRTVIEAHHIKYQVLPARSPEVHPVLCPEARHSLRIDKIKVRGI